LARSNNARFKGEAEKILGQGFGGADWATRVANYVSVGLTSTPMAETQRNLAALAKAAAETASADLADIYRRGYQRAVADGLPNPAGVIGTPRVLGNYVITPTGERREFKTRAAANKAALAWIEENAKRE
jgi:hypothetical protein